MTDRKPIGLTVPYREVGYKEKKEWEIKRPWVGLSDDEILETYRGPNGSDYVDYARGIEAKLKEKNYQKGETD